MLGWLTGGGARYHAWVRRASDHPVQHVRRMLADVVHRRGSRGVLCDVGAGGQPWLAGDVWRGRRVAVDLVPARGLDVVADGHALPLPAASVDVIVCMEVLEHVPTPSALLRECTRVLRAGGHLCLTAPQYCMTHDHPSDFYRYTREGLAWLCREAGLRVLDVRATGGPLLVLFHAVERNLPSARLRLAFVALTYRLADWLDGRITGHGNRAGVADALGWAVLAVKDGAVA